jgi:hypothetical protein
MTTKLKTEHDDKTIEGGPAQPKVKATTGPDHGQHRADISKALSSLSDPRERLKMGLGADYTALRMLVESGASKAELLAWIDESDAHRGDLMAVILG